MRQKIQWDTFPVITVILAAVNIIVYLILEWRGPTEDAGYLLMHGALYGPAVYMGREYYRLVTAMFLHFGAAHLMNNMLMLILVGQRLERTAGKIRFLLIYFVSGAAANVVCVAVYRYLQFNAVSAGASGAVFGIIGGLFGIMVRRRRGVEGIDRRQMLILIVLSLYSGFASTSVNNAAHISGLFFGFLLGFILCRARYRRKL